MPRYVVERTFPGGLEIPLTDAGANICMAVVGSNAADSRARACPAIVARRSSRHVEHGP